MHDAAPAPLLRALNGERLARPPLWLMRQAGRYLPEYRETRAKAGSFLDLCYRPDLAAEVTLQPVRRFGFDAAILFSDILVVPDALGVAVGFVEGEGPRTEIVTPERIAGLRRPLDRHKVDRVYEAIGAVKAELPAGVALIGFAGAPWTVATYLAAGRGSPDHAAARLWAFRDPDGFGRLIDALTEATIAHLSGQIAAGAEVVQLFDSWAGELPPAAFERWCIAPLVRIVRALHDAHPAVPAIAFARAAGSKLGRLAEALPGVPLGLDTAEDGGMVDRVLPLGTVVQGNLDPLALVAGGAALAAEAGRVAAAFAGRPHVFNLGHGIRPETPIAHVEALVRQVKG
ncbi:MAG TPA: uroporphyrinogen decarboxylase [Hyphomicrobiales bacterium]|nr:uroporphyrinogen decarboxylase [Hyphomicrobiales bacterium]